jgi:hypothetical protein
MRSDNPMLIDFLKMQNERVKFYGSDFWEVSKFFSGILTLLLSLPFVFLLAQHRPRWWIFAAVWSPLLAAIVAAATYSMLRRLATGYYAAAASVLSLERVLEMHEVVLPDTTLQPTVDAGRRERARQNPDEIYRSFCQRLRILRGWSRMAVMLKIFALYSMLGAAEVAVLLLKGITGINLFLELEALHRYVK